MERLNCEFAQRQRGKTGAEPARLADSTVRCETGSHDTKRRRKQQDRNKADRLHVVAIRGKFCQTVGDNQLHVPAAHSFRDQVVENLIEGSSDHRLASSTAARETSDSILPVWRAIRATIRRAESLVAKSLFA